MVATSAFYPLASGLKVTKIELGLSKPSNPTNPKGGLNFKLNIINNNSLRVNDLSNQLSNFRFYLGAIFTGNQNKRIKDDVIKELGLSGRFLENGLVFCQNFSIRSYEVGADGDVSLESIISLLQETGLNHLKVRRLLKDGLGSTPEMHKRKLIWVLTKIQIVVHRYPTWGDTIQVENRFVLFGKNTLRHESVIRDQKNGDIIVRATSNFVMMYKETRRLCRFPDEVREEISFMCKDAHPILEDDLNKLTNADCTTYEYMCPNIIPRWSDLDINQHVNNAKYVEWILESTPPSIRKSNKLYRMTLQYKRECQMDNVLESLTTIASSSVAHPSFPHHLECHHLLKLDGGAVITKARTEWIPK